MLEVYFPVFLHCTTATGTLLKSLFISRLNMSVSSSQLNFIREHLKNRCLQSAVHKVNMRHWKSIEKNNNNKNSKQSKKKKRFMLSRKPNQNVL